MSTYYILADDLRTPIAATFDEYLEWNKKHNADRRIDLTEVSPGIEVSTVFLAINHQFGDGGPILFETLIFGGPLDHEGERYYSWEEAVDGHARWVEKAKRGSL